MKRALPFLLLLASCGGGSSRTSTAPSSDDAQSAFFRGDFDAAEAKLRGATSAEDRHFLARVLLLRNRPKEAAGILDRLAAVKVATVDEALFLERVLSDLAVAQVRADDWAGAARTFARLQDPVRARKFQILAAGGGYRIDPSWEDSNLELLSTDPVPTVAATINGRRGVFVIDTAAGEIFLDRDYARRAGVTGIGVAGGGAAEEGVADELAMGRLTVRGVPVQIGRVASRAATRADGALGLSFLLRFDLAIDFRRSRLFLRRPGAAAVGVPAYLAGESNLLVSGKMNGKIDTLVGINTGLERVALASSELFVAGHGQPVNEVTAGPLKLSSPKSLPAAFPLGLDGSFGFPVGFVVGPAALGGKVLRLEPRSMKLSIE
jgi:hypothetical protein